MKLLYMAYNIKTNELYSKANSLLEGDIKRIGRIAHEILKSKCSLDLASVKEPNGFIFTRLDNDLCYFIESMENPYVFINSPIIDINPEYIQINRTKAKSSTISSLDDLSYTALEGIVQAIIDNIDNNKVIAINEADAELLKLALSLIPNKYLDYISFSYDYETKLRLKGRGDYYFNFYDPSMNSDIDIKRYAYTVVDNLKISLDNAIGYRDSIENLILKKKISISKICDLLNLIDGKLERINSVELLSEAIDNLDGMEYNKSFISTLIFTSLNKYRISKEIVGIYKFVYENVSASHTYIIKSFFDNIDTFVNLDGLGPEGYLMAIEVAVPFPLVDYLYYLKEVGLYNDYLVNAFKYFNRGYLLLDLICRDLKENKGVIVPNEELLYYLDYAIFHSMLDELDLILKRISKLNKRAPNRLLSIAIDRLFKDNHYKEFSLDLVYKVLERLDYDDYIHYFKKLYVITNNIELIDKLNEREYKNPRYYHELINLLKSDINNNEIIDLKATRLLYKDPNLSLKSLADYYNDYYLDKRKNDHGVFIDKLMSFIEDSNDLDLALDIYDRFYSKLLPTFKDTITSVRRINDYIYKFHNLIYSNVDKYLKRLDNINDKLAKGNVEANPYYALLKIGEGLKSSNDKFKMDLVRDLINYHAFNGYSDSSLKCFNKYYSNYLILEYFKYLNYKGYNDFSFVSDFRSLFDSFKDASGINEGFLRYFKNDKYNQGDLFYLILASSNISLVKYKRITLNILDRLNKKSLKKYFNDYLSYLNNSNINNEFKQKMKSFIYDYIDNNLSFITKLLLKIKNR